MARLPMNSAALACQGNRALAMSLHAHGKVPGFVRASPALLPAKWLFVEIPHVQYGNTAAPIAPALDELVPSRYAP